MRIKSLLAGVCLLAATATAAKAESWYAGGFMAPYVEADDIDFGTALGTVTTTFDGDTGFGFVAGRQHDAWRFEIEWSSRSFDVGDHILSGSALPGPTGKLDAETYFLNAIYEFNARGRVSPYLGIGAGWAQVDFESFGVAPVPAVLQDDDGGFAYQGIAGVGFDLGGRWALFADYRYLVSNDLEIVVTPAAGGVGSKVDYRAQSLQAGVRIRF